MRDVAVTRVWTDAVRFPGDTLLALARRRPVWTWMVLVTLCAACGFVRGGAVQLVPAAVGTVWGIALERGSRPIWWRVSAGVLLVSLGIAGLGHSGDPISLILADERSTLARAVGGGLAPAMLAAGVVQVIVCVPGHRWIRCLAVAAVVAVLWLFRAAATVPVTIVVAVSIWITLWATTHARAVRWVVLAGPLLLVVAWSLFGFGFSVLPRALAGTAAPWLLIGATAAGTARCLLDPGPARPSSTAALVVWQWHPWMVLQAFVVAISVYAVPYSRFAGYRNPRRLELMLLDPAAALIPVSVIVAAILSGNGTGIHARAAPLFATFAALALLFTTQSSYGDPGAGWAILVTCLLVGLLLTAWTLPRFARSSASRMLLLYLTPFLVATPAVVTAFVPEMWDLWFREVQTLWIAILGLALLACAARPARTLLSGGLCFGAGVLSAVCWHFVHDDRLGAPLGDAVLVGGFYATFGVLASAAGRATLLTAIPRDHPVYEWVAMAQDSGRAKVVGALAPAGPRPAPQP